MKELIEKLSTNEQTIVQNNGPIKLFALFERLRVPSRWDVVIASNGLPENDIDVLKDIIEKIRAVLSKEEMIKIAAVILLDVNDHFVNEVQQFLEEHHNPTAFSNAEINGSDISRGYIITSPVSSSEKVSPKSSELLTSASQWIRKAATQGDTEAQNTLGLMYLKGEGVKQNLNQAKKWFRKAATLGHAQAQHHLEALQR
jgi:hypothetical protein